MKMKLCVAALSTLWIVAGCKTTARSKSTLRDVMSAPDQSAALGNYRAYCGECHVKFKVPDDGQLLANLQAESVKIQQKLAWDSTAADPDQDDDRMPPIDDSNYADASQNKYKLLKASPDIKSAMLAILSGGNQTTVPTKLPLNQLTLPPGFKIAVFATVPGARSMTLSPQGTLYVGTGGLGSNVDDRVFVIPHADSITSFPGQPLAITTGVGGARLVSPNGVAFSGNALFVAEWNRIIRYDNIEGNWTTPTPPVSISGSFFNLIKYHEWKFLAFGPDGKLYVNVGAHDNLHASLDPYASIVRLNPDGSNIEIFAKGVRNSVGFDWHPTTHELWFTENGCDQLGPDSPPDELDRAPNAGMDFGFPYCFGNDVFVSTYAKGRTCANRTQPAALFDPHSAAVGMRFYTGQMFPPEYQGAIFVAEHGSWARAQYNVPPTGYQVVVAKLDGNNVTSVAPFATGWSNYKSGSAENDWGRPTDVQVMPDGALLVSDSNGVIYRISYQQ